MENFITTKVEVINGQEMVIQVYPPQGQIPEQLIKKEKFSKLNYYFKKDDMVSANELCNWNDDAIYC